MQSKTPLNRVILENVAWFLGALALAFLVWIIATAQLNPVEEWRFNERVPIRVAPDEGLVITNQDEFARNATVIVRAQQSVRELLSADDIIIAANLDDLPPGEHTVTLVAETSRPDARIIDISPRQITVNLEEIASRLVEVRADITDPPPFGYEMAAEPELDTSQVTITGPASRVEQVAAVEVPLDLSRRREPFQDFARPIPVDADGIPVPNVTVDTQIIGVQVDIQPLNFD